VEEFLRNRTVPLLQLERILLITAWARADPPGAMNWAVRWEPASTRKAAMAQAMGAWARQDPEALVQAYDVVSLSKDNLSALVALVEGWFESNPEGVEAFILDMNGGDERQRAIRVLARLRIARDGGIATREWAQNLRANKAFKRTLYSHVGGQLVSVDLEQAIEWCRAVCDMEVGNSTVHKIGVEWAKFAGADAMDWLLLQPTTLVNRAAIRATYRRFLIDGRKEALAWMETTKPEMRREQMLQGPVGMYLIQRSWRDPEIGIEWTQYLLDDSERENALVTIAKRWLKNDESAAEAWLTQSPLSEESRERARSLSRQKLGGARAG
jgi:hypothetical protein